MALLTKTALSARAGLLNFTGGLRARYESDTGEQRVRHLRRMILLGLFFFNLHDFSGFVTQPRYAWLGVGLHSAILTPVALLIAYLTDKVRDRHREAMCGFGCMGATAIPMLLFFLSDEPLSPFVTAEILLTVVFANITLALRFPWACCVSAFMNIAMVVILCLKPEVGAPLCAVILLNLISGTIFSLTANYRIEHSTRQNYLLTLQETLRVSSLTARNDTLAHLSVTDTLTGLSNRRFLEERTPAWNAGIALGRAFAVVLVDVDYFKRFNDVYGHGAGDECLRQLSGVFREEGGREADLVIRLGGEEFLIILPDRTLEHAFDVAERVRLRVQRLAIAHEARPDGLCDVTVSLGIAATVIGGGAALETLIKCADEALYAAKSSGRNRTHMPLPRSPLPGQAA